MGGSLYEWVNSEIDRLLSRKMGELPRFAADGQDPKQPQMFHSRIKRLRIWVLPAPKCWGNRFAQEYDRDRTIPKAATGSMVDGLWSC
jgi:hypothetical protein